MVTNSSVNNPQSNFDFRKAINAGWIAVKSAFIVSAGFSACVIGLVGIGAISAGVDSLRALFEPNLLFGLLSILLSFVVILFPPFAISIIPAFFSGMFLAYLFSREAQHNKLTIQRGVRIATIIGFVEGMILSAIFSPIIFNLQIYPAHNMPPPPVNSAVLGTIVFACLAIVMASIVGAWAGKQIVNSFIL